jgi:hypothetical protein
MVSHLSRIQSSRFRAAPRVFFALTNDFSLYNRVVKFLGIFRGYSCPRASREAADRLF